MRGLRQRSPGLVCNQLPLSVAGVWSRLPLGVFGMSSLILVIS
jgi:hypothetical protein